ncbi:MAG TPA: MBOAT family protein [Candidatus Sumerlaeota bacterium]|nr:MBOAT family protein [Candidatus Sumerlaeota bacterium]
MTFNSLAFLIFLPIVLGLYYLLPFRWQNRMLLLASYVFYGWWNWKFLILILISPTVDYVCGMLLDRSQDQRTRRRILITSMAMNLIVLGYFKYANFFIDSAHAALAALGIPFTPLVLDVVLPIGISFHTFQSMSYAIDIYRGKLKPIRRIDDFALFVAYFPQLVAGPIERAANLLPQIVTPRRITADGFVSGFWLVLLGYVKKTAIADAVAPFVNDSFARAHDPTAGGLEILGAAYLFAIQIYGDFSGYSDIARGISRMMGIELMVNFRMPYLATSVTDFWRRWHISLSTWLRDYLYIPLGGNRHGLKKTYRNLMLTMLLGGLWHGANWTFVMWGFLHGIFLAIHRMMRGENAPEVAPPPLTMRTFPARALKVVATFHLVCLAWIFFRAKDFDDAFTMIGKIVSLPEPFDWSNILRFAVYGGIVLSFDMIQERLHSDEPFPMRLPALAGGLIAAIFILMLFAFGGKGDAFIYFQF